jgi:hypothetical protein
LTKKSVVLTAFLAVGTGLLQVAQSQNSPQPLELEMRVPFDPGEGRSPNGPVRGRIFLLDHNGHNHSWMDGTGAVIGARFVELERETLVRVHG